MRSPITWRYSSRFFEGHVGLDLEDALDVVRVRDEVLVPEVRVTHALGVGEPRPGHVGDVADAALPEVADERVLGLVVEPPSTRPRSSAGPRRVIGRELLAPLLGVEVVLVDRLLPHDRVEVVAALRQAGGGRGGAVALRVDERVALRVHVDLEVARDERRACRRAASTASSPRCGSRTCSSGSRCRSCRCRAPGAPAPRPRPGSGTARRPSPGRSRGRAPCALGGTCSRRCP